MILLACTHFACRGVLPVASRARPPTDLPEPTAAAAAATDAEPGSAAKIAVMAARARRGETIFHPDDNGSTSQVREHEELPCELRRALGLGRGRGARIELRRPRPGDPRRAGRWRVRVWLVGEQRYRNVGTFDSRAEAEAAAETALRD
jgi:hypothetical protein